MEFIQKQSISNNLPTTTSTVVGGRYILGPIIGKGSFGEVYLATVKGEETFYAIKKEEEQTKHQHLNNQSKILKSFDKSLGFPKVYWFGQQNRANYLVFDLLGPSLQDLFFLCQRQFSLKTVIMLADQMIARIEQLHTQNYLHRDIKPQNFLIGLQDKSHIVHLIDFGLSKRYRDPKTHQHIPYKQNRPVIGTVRYSSINSHFCFQQSRRDDLESIGYILIYFLQGSLPWQGIKANKKAERYEKIQEKKQSVPIQLLCKGLPIEFCTFMNYCNTLKFQQKPDYKYLRKLFRDLFERIGYSWDYQYDWCNFTKRKQVEVWSINFSIQAKGDQIHNLNQESAKIKEVDQSQIQLKLQTRQDDPWKIVQNQSDNLVDVFQESNVSMLANSGKALFRSKKMQFKQMEEW